MALESALNGRSRLDADTKSGFDILLSYHLHMARGGGENDPSLGSADSILYGKRPSLSDGQEEFSARSIKDDRSVRQLIEDGDSAHNYWSNCDICQAEMGVNMYGMGTCPECGHHRNPLKNN